MQYTNDLTGSLGQIRQVFNANTKTAYTPFEVPYRRVRAKERGFFIQPAAGSPGLTAQLYFRGPSNRVADSSVFKVFRLPFLEEQGALPSRFEFINAFNHTRFGSPTFTLTSASFGQISAPTGNFRIIQTAMKVIF